MAELNNNEQMLDIYLFETFQNLEQLERCILDTEKLNAYSEASVNEIFRMMHTIKGSSAMMLFNNISGLAHAMEDLFYYIRERKPTNVNATVLSDLLLEGIDFIKIELEKIKEQDSEDGSCEELLQKIKSFLSKLKELNHEETPLVKQEVTEKIQYYIIPDKAGADHYKYSYKATIFFEEGCEMENIRAYTVIHNIKQFTDKYYHLPADIMDSTTSITVIRESGFTVYLKTDRDYVSIKEFFNQIIFLKSLELIQLEDEGETARIAEESRRQQEDNVIKVPKRKNQGNTETKETVQTPVNQSIISVNVAKLDTLMDLVGELVISEALVTQNPELEALEIESFQKASRQLHKITSELQDIVMSIRMVPLSATFQKMHRLVRDMDKNLNKETELILVGEETEVDKNIIEHISDPLMHLVRNSLDHGIEDAGEREASGKDRTGKIILEAKHSGSDVLITVKDDGRGLNKQKILTKAKDSGLLNKPEQEVSDKEAYNFIFLPGFSTKDSVSEYSGRGVGMDVVTKNLEKIGGTVSVESKEGIGSAITLKIPLTLAIIDGMNVKVGDSRYTIPLTAITESFRPDRKDIIIDPDGNEMIIVRGKCHKIQRLHQIFRVQTHTTNLTEGILIMVEQEGKTLCLFADELLGQQQVVVKTLPDYIVKMRDINGISGCTLLGDGSISLIIDIQEFINR